MWDRETKRFALAIAFGVVATVALIVGMLWYDAAHHCRGTGRYHHVTECTQVGKVITCYPVRVEDELCDK